METLKRGIKNILRNKSRNIAVLLILSLSLSLALIMVNMDFLSNQKIKSIREKMGGNRFTVVSSYECYIIGKKEPYDEEKSLIDEAIADEILKIDNVKSVEKLIYGSFYSEKLKQIGRTIEYKYEGEYVEEITHDISIYGEDFEDRIVPVKPIKGNIFKKDDIDQNVAVISETFAERNNLDVGSNIIINKEKIKIIGIVDARSLYEIRTGETYMSFNMKERGMDMVYIPLKTAQRLLGKEGKVNSLLVTVDSIDNVQKTVDYINNTLSDGKIVAMHGIEDLPGFLFFNNLKRISKVTVISSFIVGASIIVLIMFINTRNRAKEIGILKAIGASNINITLQFLSESISLCIIALILSTLVTLAISQPLADFISEREIAKREITEIVGNRLNILTDKEIKELPDVIKEMSGYKEIEELKSMNLKNLFSPQILIIAILLTLTLAVIGTLIPAYYISKLRPAEVLRFE
jgi:ABC-type antimicrobial peptide transport system permease subunit